MTLSKQEVLENLDTVKNYITEIENEKLQEKKEIYLEIKNRWTGDIIFKSTKTVWKDAVEEAIKSKANLSVADLSKADLSGANLSEADLSKANLSGANLSEADLSKADLSGANLSEADLSKANLSGADLSEANLSVADLSEANLSEADLSKADLSGANLSEADLSGADLSWANLNGCLFYMGAGNRNFEALCKAIKTIRHQDGKFEDLCK
jgi:uncharacterized protein YjbI with pentapeptide repeats